MAGDIAVLLRDNYHSNANTIRYALKCNDFVSQVAKTPIQIPIAQTPPTLIDIGFFRPAITITGLVDDIGGNPSNTTAGYHGMTSVSHTGYDDWDVATKRGFTNPDSPSYATSTQTYYIPYKNALEEACYKWISNDNTPLEIEIADSTIPVGYTYNSTAYQSTGGGIWEVAIQQARFQKQEGSEDRWEFTMQFVAKSRKDVF